MTVGEKVKQFRKSAGISQLELEFILSASTGSISRIENNIINPTKETLFKIAEKLGLDYYQTASLLGIEFNLLERYVAKKYLSQTIDSNIGLKEFVNSEFKDYAYLTGKEFFIDECDSSLENEDKEVLYIFNVPNWRQVYPEDYAKITHVPMRLKKHKFAKFLLNPTSNSIDFKRQDTKYFRESRILRSNLNFDFNLMITQEKLSIFFGGNDATTFTIKNSVIANNANNLFNLLWERNI